MAFDQKPSTWLGTGYLLATSQAKLNTATHASPVAVPELTDAEADPTTGDVRKLFYALVAMMHAAYAAQAAADRPTRMVISRATLEDSSGNITRNFSFQFTLSGSLDVAGE